MAKKDDEKGEVKGTLNAQSGTLSPRNHVQKGLRHTSSGNRIVYCRFHELMSSWFISEALRQWSVLLLIHAERFCIHYLGTYSMF